MDTYIADASADPNAYVAYIPIPRTPSPRDRERRSISPRDHRNRDAAYPAPPRPRHAPSRVEPNPVLGVFGLSVRTRERDLEDEFLRYGDVDKVVIVYDQKVCCGELYLIEILLMRIDGEVSRLRLHYHA